LGVDLIDGLPGNRIVRETRRVTRAASLQTAIRKTLAGGLSESAPELAESNKLIWGQYLSDGELAFESQPRKLSLGRLKLLETSLIFNVADKGVGIDRHIQVSLCVAHPPPGLLDPLSTFLIEAPDLLDLLRGKTKLSQEIWPALSALIIRTCVTRRLNVLSHDSARDHQDRRCHE
jgi:hypothetical protein